MRDFGRRLRAARIAAGYEDAADLARDLGIEEATYRKYERGGALPRVDVLECIVQTTGKSLDWLLLGAAQSRRD